MFKVGQVVVCINGDGWEDKFGIPDTDPHPKKDGLFTIEEITFSSGDRVFLHLMGFCHRWYAPCFRPIVSNSARQSTQPAVDKLKKYLKQPMEVV